MTRLAEALLITVGLLILGARYAVTGLVTAGLPAVGLLVAALVSGLVRTAVLLVVFPLVAVAYVAVRLADAAGRAVPTPHLPRLVEVSA
ncbi:hypothetical protein [Saccharopolyspora rosea]|uniref:Uncharacterized protein n=1 Tax=Saccharopolyspora rosea TaxID=524884 RepID=A0ABW3FZE5_9PSEU|nr:hypothetical protein [Saccharopolyspora rosea]